MVVEQRSDIGRPEHQGYRLVMGWKARLGQEDQ